jgi:hypothetical protein
VKEHLIDPRETNGQTFDSIGCGVEVKWRLEGELAMTPPNSGRGKRRREKKGRSGAGLRALYGAQKGKVPAPTTMHGGELRQARR